MPNPTLQSSSQRISKKIINPQDLNASICYLYFFIETTWLLSLQSINSAHFTTVIIIAHTSHPHQSCCWAYQFRLRVLTDIVEPFHASSNMSYLLRIYDIKYRCTLNILLSLKLEYLCGLYVQTSTPTQHIYIYINIQYTIYSDRLMRKEK